MIEKVTGITLEEYLYVLALRLTLRFSNLITSKKNFFDPLGMKTTSFYLSPELERNKVPLNLRRGGKLELFDPNQRLFETDPSKGDFRGFSSRVLTLTIPSTPPVGWNRSLLYCKGLLDLSTTFASNTW